MENLCFLPTPFEKMQNLSEHFKEINLFFKREDQTGLAMGGNKARKMEFIMADVLQKQANSPPYKYKSTIARSLI